ncbi:polysaccharide biosynthesis tyrosine autokinase [Dyella flava]|uniref:Polysaccharide biosynthesis tyrosine autokinase n=1 Tax=Dyella flava TaxID=1920170 RepID=A0ABS2JZD6_9GAMM|nr:polysaccharide biosynthesis tyrosine autokinase [Dyella flava]MBM7123994.1 polysaccharide biosynthesis tyrosine autokinase [Dyella flava]GLQ50560.1 protein-tyrosine kinase [Dyella flava]
MSSAREHSPSQRDEEIDLNALLGTLIDHKWLIIAVTSIFFVLSVAYAVLAAPVYEADAMVQVEQKVPDLPGLSAITQTLGASDSEDLTEIAIITSRSVIGKAVDNLNLNIVVRPHHFPMFGGFIARHYVPEQAGDVANPWLGMARYGWGGEKLDVFQLDVPDGLLGKALTLVAGENGAYTLLDDDGNALLHGHIGQSASGHGVTIQVKTLIANPGMRFEVMRNRELATISQLRYDITTTEEGKDSGIIGLTYQNKDPELATQILDQVTKGYVLQNVDKNSAQAANSLQFVKQQLPLTRESLDKAQDALNAFQIKAHSVNISLQTKALLDQGVALETSIQQLQLQQADMERRFTKDHPAYKALLQQIGQLQAQKADLDKQVGDLPDTQRDLLRLTEDVQVSNNTYAGLLNQAQQLEIAKAGTVGNVRVVDPAAVDVTQPVKPKKLIVILGGTILGALLAAAFIFIRQTLNRGVENPADIEQLGLPVYASIPLSKSEELITLRDKRVRSDGNQHLLALTSPADLATEALRSLRTSLHFAQLEAKNNLLMISGASPQAGKTFVSSNLAVVIAQSGRRVLLIDADMRKGALHKAVGGKPENGLSEFIAGQIDRATAIRSVPGVEGLSFIARGKVPPNPSELLMNARFTARLQELMGLYDLVIIDTPPVLAVTDAAVIGRHAGTSLLVVRFGHNQLREIALAKQRFDQNGVDIKGFVFNAVQKRSAGYYSYGYYEYEAAK